MEEKEKIQKVVYVDKKNHQSKWIFEKVEICNKKK